MCINIIRVRVIIRISQFLFASHADNYSELKYYPHVDKNWFICMRRITTQTHSIIQWSTNNLT